MLEPADLLLLDEPTNDLDIATLEVLEESLLEYKGALVLVTHDRYMLDRVATTVLGLDGQGNAAGFADYSQWEEWFVRQGTGIREQGTDAFASTAKVSAASVSAAKRKLSYLEAREFAGIEERVEAADRRLEEAKTLVADPAIAVDATKLTEALKEMEAAQAEVDALYARWAELTEKVG
jgi:ATP-binding cassette subfamily F protein uup